MFKGLTARSVMLSTLALMALTACGDAGLLGQNKKSMRGNADGSHDPRDSGEEGGSLSLTMPAGHAQFAKVSTIEIRIWPQSSENDGPVTGLPPSNEPKAPIARSFAYKPGEKANVSDVPTGKVYIEVDLLDASNQALFTGFGHARVQKGQTASAMVDVSPTPGKGGVTISIQPAPTPVTSPVSAPDRNVWYCELLALPKK